MKRNIILLITITVLPLSGYGQIGINTDNTHGLFHIDAASTAASTNPAVGSPSILQQSDDLCITNSGSLGLGTIQPSEKLDINGIIRIQGGNPANKKVLVSDDINGNSVWGDPPGTFSTINPLSTNLNISPTGLPYSFTGIKIIFPRIGTYSITLGARLTISAATKVDYVLIQFLPKNDPSLWSSITNRFKGSYEVYSTAARPNDSPNVCRDWRFYLSENITITESTGTTAFLFVGLAGTFPVGATGNFAITNITNLSGGSYVKVN